MVLIIHITVALGSLISSGSAFFYPSVRKIQITYALTALMLTTGFYLVLTKPVNMTQTCIEGLVFLGVVASAIIGARKKLASLN